MTRLVMGSFLVLFFLSCSAHQPDLRGFCSTRCPARGDFGKSGYHSQYYEDYILSYVFRARQQGTYIDVGANHPDKSNLTKRFYLAGWRGINIEPNPEMFKLLQEARQNDVNLNVGISDRAGALPFYRFAGSAHPLSTFDREIALQHKEKNLSFEEIPVPLITLNEVFEKNPFLQGRASFLNIDVEGFESKVLASIDLDKVHPEVIVVESTRPLTETISYQEWESILKNHGYLFATSDGLNRYYVHQTQRALLKDFVEISLCVNLDKLQKNLHLDGFKKIPTS